MPKAIQHTLTISDLISPKLSAGIAMKIASIPGKPKRPERERLQLEGAQKGEYIGAYGKENPYWAWGEGPVVILCHGWGGRGSQLATLAIEIANAGCKAVTFDASAHGNSHGKTSGFDVMAKDIQSISELFPQIHAYVCHSMGGMSAMNARKLGLDAKKFVIIGSPYAPLPIIEIMKTQLKVPPKTLEVCKDRLATQFDTHWERLMEGEIFKDIQQPSLLIYDKIDKGLPPNSILHYEYVKSQCQNVESLITEGLGHRKLLWAPDVIEQVIGFLNKDATT